jgi:hypothetical protein
VREELQDLLQVQTTDDSITIEAATIVAKRIRDALHQEFSDAMQSLMDESQSDLEFTVNRFPDHNDETRFGMGVTLRRERPADVSTAYNLSVSIAGDLNDPFPFRIQALHYPRDRPGAEVVVAELNLRYEDAFPDLSTNALVRVKLFIEETQKLLLVSLRERLEVALRQAGYRAL